MHRLPLPALLTFLCGMAAASSARAHTIVVVRPDASDPILTEVFSRLCGELRMYGLGVNVTSDEEVAPSPGMLRTEDAGSTDVVGGVSLLRTPGQATAKIWIAEVATGKEGLRITVSIDDADAPSLLAVRAVDLVRASLRDTDLAERAPPETKPDATAGVSTSNAAPPPAAPDRLDRWAIRAGATALWETGDLGAGLAVTVAIARRISPRLALELALMAPAVGQTYTTTAATAELRQELGTVAVAWRVLEGRRVALDLSQGFGATHLRVRGDAQSPWLPQSTSAWATISSTGARLGLRLSDHIGLDVSLAALFLLPRPVLEVADVSYQVYQPLILATGGLRYGF